MPCTIVVGGQFGSEGKGKVVSLMAARMPAPLVVRCGGPNSGHTTAFGSDDVVLRQVPAGVTNPNATLALAAGCVIDETVLADEVARLGLTRERLLVDPRAVIVETSDREAEAEASERIGSTASGTGAALIRRMRRVGSVRLAADSDVVQSLAKVERIAPLVHDTCDQRGDVIVEGTQGFGLSLLHGPDYPYVTARDTTASAFASEVGIPPRLVDAVCVVIRTFPIRVGGNSGPLRDEITWEAVSGRSGVSEVRLELTSVTRKVRRVALFDLDLVRAASRFNGATEIAVMGLDRLDGSNSSATRISDLSLDGRRLLREIVQATRVDVSWVGVGFGSRDAFHAKSDAIQAVRQASV